MAVTLSSVRNELVSGIEQLAHAARLPPPPPSQAPAVLQAACLLDEMRTKLDLRIILQHAYACCLCPTPAQH